MRKLIVGMMVAAFALGAFCEDNNPLIVSDNLFGSIKLDTKSEFTMVAAPFEGFASQFEDSKVDLTQTSVANTILVRDVVAVEKLIDTDTLSVFNPAATDDKTEFDNYIARMAQVKIGKVTYSYMEWLASMWFEEETMISHKFDDPDKRLVPTGSGVFIGRDVDKIPSNGFSIYAYGQIPMSFPYDQDVVVSVGKTMLSAPGELAYKAINLNEITWNGGVVGLSTWDYESDEYTEEDFGFPEVIWIDSLPKNADTILCYDPKGAANALQSRIEFVYHTGKKKWYRRSTKNSYIASANENDAVIPAGSAFWYVKKSGSDVTFKWPSAVSVAEAGDSSGDAGGNGDAGNTTNP